MPKYYAARLLCIVLAASLTGACSYAPLHDVLVKPEHIKAGVRPGDTVEIETTEGKTVEFVVTAVTADAVEGDGQRVPISDMQKIGVRSWKEPQHPCGAGEPVGCSIPEVVLVLSDNLLQQADKFHRSCVTHDFCYRHGFATYGIERVECDKTFYQDMQTECGSGGALSVLDVKEYSLCNLAARQTFDAVRRHGEPAFRRSTSSYCEYR